jgi:hypothetical protein
MGRSYSYLPNRDADLLGWASAASETISGDPESFGLSAEIAEGFAAAVQAFASAMVNCEPGVRNAMAVSIKNKKKELLKKSARSWASIVGGTPGVTDAQRHQLGLTVRRAMSPVAGPTSAPVMQIDKVDGRVVRVRLRGESTGLLRGRPIGTRGAAVYSHAGATPPVDLSEWTLVRSTGKTLLNVTFDASLPPGATVWLMAAWIGTRLQLGPACRPVSVTFGAASVMSFAG